MGSNKSQPSIPTTAIPIPVFQAKKARKLDEISQITSRVTDFSGDITILGATSVAFSSNLVGVVFPSALRIRNAKRVSVEGNLFELAAQPRRALAEISLAKSSSLEDDYAKCLVTIAIAHIGL